MGLLRRSQGPNVARKDRKYLGRTNPAQDIEIVAANGSRLRDAQGGTYIDFQCGWCVGNLGWNPPEILARVRSFEGPTYVAPGVLYEPWTELAELLVDLAPGSLARAFRCVGGTEAVDLALQLAMKYTGRHKIVSIDGAYHGNSIGARAIGADDGEVHVPGFKKLAPPLDAKALDRLETVLKHRDVAAFIMEPIVLNLAVLIPDTEFMQGLVELCHRYGTLVIMDEVGTAFGRCGRMYASELFGIEPDIMPLAKAITAGVAPLATVLTTEEVAEAELDFYSTFGWHPVAVEAAIGVQHYWREHRDAVLANIVERSVQMRQQLSLMEWPMEPELRIQGLACAVDVGDKNYVRKLEAGCRDGGLLAFAEDEAFVMFPALTIDHDTLQEGLDIIADCVRR
ncbi:MAG TPA: aspartate aminotransferase family protein [Kofleriaceae bacterium]